MVTLKMKLLNHSAVWKRILVESIHIPKEMWPLLYLPFYHLFNFIKQKPDFSSLYSLLVSDSALVMPEFHDAWLNQCWDSLSCLDWQRSWFLITGFLSWFFSFFSPFTISPVRVAVQFTFYLNFPFFFISPLWDERKWQRVNFRLT